ncbi:MAG: hypothetical protein IT353_16595 [Gemmatimonadaceae bacterium]|nr:hypothetical protein [Gemmatimonadaceae bacterium]
MMWTAGCHRASVGQLDSVAVPIADSTRSVAPASASRIPRDAARFEIDVVSDSTIRFKPREMLWVRAGMVAYVVDPMNRDALVARTRVLEVWNETAVGVVTSQVTRVTTKHVVLLTPPVVPWWKKRAPWVGALIGALVGGTAGALVAR